MLPIFDLAQKCLAFFLPFFDIVGHIRKISFCLVSNYYTKFVEKTVQYLFLIFLVIVRWT